MLSSNDFIIVTSAIPMDTEQKQMLENLLKTKYGIEGRMEFRTDKKVLAGFTVTYNNWYLDASVARELKEMKKRIDGK